MYMHRHVEFDKRACVVVKFKATKIGRYMLCEDSHHSPPLTNEPGSVSLVPRPTAERPGNDAMVLASRPTTNKAWEQANFYYPRSQTNNQ